jgi:probable F420-dependent oxidoreductase
MKLGKLGVWNFTDGWTVKEAAAFAKKVEDWGYSAFWIPEGFGRDALVHSAWLLANTSKLVIATGIANIYARDPMAMASAQKALNEQSGGRFLLGIGVSHAPMVQGRGHAYQKPIATMRAYLETMQKAPYMAPPPREKPPTILAALGPKMLELARDMADGVHPYNVPPEHTAMARKILGPDKLLCVEQKCILETDIAKGREGARKALALYMTLGEENNNYKNMWRQMGFDNSDWPDGQASDRLLDAVFVIGDEATIRKRIQAHWDAGADHVCVQAMGADGSQMPNERLLQALAPGK